MDAAGGELEFRNREQELERLLDCVPPRSDRSAITFLRAPTGFGKTRLVDEVLSRLDQGGPRCVIVEPEIRARHRSSRVYAWYFVQRAAAATTEQNEIDSPTFSRFLKRQRVRRVNWHSFYEAGKEAFSISKLVKLSIEFGENLLGRNRFHPNALLKDEGAFATGLAREYLEWLARLGPTLFVVREAHLIDLESFRFLLNLHRSATHVFCLFEYTSDSEFFPEHQKIVEECRVADSNMRIVDLLRLNKKEFLFLLKKYVREDIESDSNEFVRWNGNLRLVRELKDNVYVERAVDEQHRPTSIISDLRILIYDRIQTLGNTAKLALACVVCHIEALPETVLNVAIRKVETSVDDASIHRAVVELITGSRYLKSTSGRLTVSDEDVASVVAESPSFARFRALAERALREVYLGAMSGDRSVLVPLPLAFRQAIALCLATGDAAALRHLIRTLADGARSAHDQGMYVSLVADAMFRGDRARTAPNSELVDWAAVTAYEIGDYRLSAELIEASPTKSTFHDGLLGFCYGETNRHAEALEIGRSLESSYTSESPIHALGRLIQVVNLFAIGQKTEAGRMHAEIRSDPRLFSTPLFGYALRFTELLENFPECTTDVLQSVDHFDSYGMSASAAYSALSGAMHLAYAGDISQASTQIERAKQFLEREVRDLHILFNNEVVINLLSDKPNFDTCITTLDRAAYSVKDEFYRAVIENNRLICRWSLGKVEDAKHSVALLEEAMRNPGFGNRDVFWTFTYNCWAFLREIGDGARAEAFLEELNGVKVEQLDYEDYWHFRFGRATRPPARYDHLLKFKYHPEYLSHWIVDVDAMRDGRAGQLS